MTIFIPRRLESICRNGPKNQFQHYHWIGSWGSFFKYSNSRLPVLAILTRSLWWRNQGQGWKSEAMGKNSSFFPVKAGLSIQICGDPRRYSGDGSFSGPHPTPFSGPMLAWLWATGFLYLHELPFKFGGGQLGSLTWLLARYALAPSVLQVRRTRHSLAWLSAVGIQETCQLLLKPYAQAIFF